MNLTIFSRLFIVYCIIVVIVLSVSIFAILKLREFNAGTQHILRVDNRIVDIEEELNRLILSQVRFEKKYMITQDPSLYDQFISAKNEFTKGLAEARALVDTTPKRETMERIETAYSDYQSLVEREAKEVRAKRSYPARWFEREKERAVDAILANLETLEGHSRRDIALRMKALREGANSAQKLALLISGLAFFFVLGMSLLITRSITRPLHLLMGEIKEISKGVFQCDLKISSPPEIAELTRAFNAMCERLAAVDKMKSDFFATMSHELRTPLASLREGTNLLLEGVGGPLTEKQKRLLTILSGESNRLIGLVNSVLDLSKMEAGMMTYRFQQGSLSSLLEQALAEMVPLFEAKKIALETKMDSSIPSIFMDSEKMLQALRNLLGNAVKFTPDGGRIRVDVVKEEKKVKVSVQDSGPGIPKEYLSTIFNKFQQVSSTETYGSKGTGLGLAIAKHIVTSHGGEIWAESQPGEGSTFCFVLPLASSSGETDALPPKKESRGSSSV